MKIKNKLLGGFSCIFLGYIKPILSVDGLNAPQNLELIGSTSGHVPIAAVETIAAVSHPTESQQLIHPEAMSIGIDVDTHSGIFGQSLDDHQDQVDSPLINFSEIPGPSEWSPSRSINDLHHEHEPHVDMVDPLIKSEVDERRPTRKRPRLTEKSPVTLENIPSTSAGPHPSAQDEFLSDDNLSAALLKDLAEQGELPMMLSDFPEASTSMLDSSKNQHATPDPATPGQHIHGKDKLIETATSERTQHPRMERALALAGKAAGIGPIPASFKIDVFPFVNAEDNARKAYTTIASFVPMFPLEDTDTHQVLTHKFKGFEYLPVRMVERKGKDVMIRIIDRDNSYLPTTNIRGLLIHWLECLISLQYLVARGSQLDLKARTEEYKELLSWTTVEMFFPKESLPVVGAVRSEQLQKGFGLVQRWIIWYLYSEDPKKAHLTAIAILGIWYKTHRPEQWQKCMKINSCFWSVISGFTSHLMERIPNLKKVDITERSTKIPPQLGSLKLDALKKSVRKLQLNHLIIKFRTQQEEIVNKEKSILDRFLNLYKELDKISEEVKAGSAHSIPTRKINGVSCLFEPSKNLERSEDTFAIRHIDNLNQIIPTEIIHQRLQDFLESLRWWHEILNQGLKLWGGRPIENAHQCLLECLEGILFEAKHSLPVFGFINANLHDIVDGPPAFGNMQLFLIHLLTDTTSSEPTLATNSITFTSYWYHSYFNKRFWQNYLKKNQDLVNYIMTGLAHRSYLPHLSMN
ncbi:hypothetical protein PSTG_14272 [Puccinia striiformis f. sp. tritici PST-78]|uniref:Uncharacterized protein n=1 Tax=Puccinia striiformis f. sp. tritici PST-78 TaxID=1165861 RepID=A0A0L0UZ38_9BASI|nr:hypothetical protein PSTG_14272 [Puccinia striiformis f. sp. tritici PST-78]